jgi:hypothetical protein
VCWVLGPALGAGLAAHELEHHESGELGSAEVAERVLPVLHGHFHEEGTSPHSHEAVPPAATLAPGSVTKQLSAVADTSVAALRGSGLSVRPPVLELAAPRAGPVPVSSASLQDLCILRL